MCVDVAPISVSMGRTFGQLAFRVMARYGQRLTCFWRWML
ncbi:hypothetical protein MA5S0422_0762 [Mycobacteroides abscessus 5S-0422]|uniref:Uncharacterized protein n=1 Tax=Mycobacteroides abscessus subsp. bolletii 1513 TaxID=1299321 RepID=X8E1J8_9MYCO|nr:hypothetical protein MA5S0422_0762 [Mycobacteroides abscessus 5S-0422]EIU32542.1 hypothetical protein MA5S0708_0670 [Mycobacteroides abscessus 5S-0708]EIU35608.1 hypothetical protein MA5S1212_0342 [Mycobacteroides abscessus 5S-1212]EUA74121.1 hypothetical protein I540_0835 [Mycobacteroides abscessus subsp. bolletii 1513]